MLRFIKKERRITMVLILAICFALASVFTNRLPELFLYGHELIELIYGLSISIIAAVIFYIFQIYLPSTDIRKISEKEFKQMCNRFIGVFTDVLISCSTKKEIEDLHITNLDDFLSNAVAIQIARYFDLEAEANYSPKMSWANRLAILGKEIRDGCDIIASKYSIYLSEDMLHALHEIKNNAFIESIRILSNPEVINFQKEYIKRTGLYFNLIESSFELLKSINKKLELNLAFSPGSFNSQKGLYEKARINIEYV